MARIQLRVSIDDGALSMLRDRAKRIGVGFPAYVSRLLECSSRAAEKQVLDSLSDLTLNGPIGPYGHVSSEIVDRVRANAARKGRSLEEEVGMFLVMAARRLEGEDAKNGT